MKHDPATGRFVGPSKTAEERFWPKVRKSRGCWTWTAAKTPLGYGVFWNGERLVCAHRFSYELIVGPIATGLDIDHLCRNPSCVNPDHLDPVTHAVNSQRGETGEASGRAQRSKTHCPRGHPYNAENTYITPSTGSRHCRKCRRAHDIARRKRLRSSA